MRIKKTEFLISNGEFADSKEFAKIMEEVYEAIEVVTWGDDKKFIINPVRLGNGVKAIKKNFVAKLQEYGWKDEVRMTLAKGMNPGAIDVVKDVSFGKFAVEWETGNISSSHRALNKIAVGIIQGEIIGGILIVPVKSLAKYLTDRIGNLEELMPYFPMYNNLQIENGVFAIIAIEHDEESTEVDLIPKGNDGNAKKK